MTADLHTVLARLHRFYEGALLIDGRFETVPYCIDPMTARPVFSALPGVLDAHELTLHIPEDEPGALHLFGRAAPLDDLRDEACDRYQMYFGRPRWAHFAALEIENLKNFEIVLDGPEVRIPNPLRSCEARLVKMGNADEGALRSACQRHLAIAPTAPRIIGIDPYGIDIRADRGPVRLEFPAPALTDAVATHALQALLTEGA